jgi:hypothetical protein
MTVVVKKLIKELRIDIWKNWVNIWLISQQKLIRPTNKLKDSY